MSVQISLTDREFLVLVDILDRERNQNTTPERSERVKPIFDKLAKIRFRRFKYER